MEDVVRHLDRATWRKYLFYIDMVVWGIFAVAVAYVVSNIYLVGFYEGNADLATHEEKWWRTMIGFSFMMGSLSWVFFRFWRNGYMALRRPF